MVVVVVVVVVRRRRGERERDEVMRLRCLMEVLGDIDLFCCMIQFECVSLACTLNIV